jgi:hypothetical protein
LVLALVSWVDKEMGVEVTVSMEEVVLLQGLDLLP